MLKGQLPSVQFIRAGGGGVDPECSVQSLAVSQSGPLCFSPQFGGGHSSRWTAGASNTNIKCHAMIPAELENHMAAFTGDPTSDGVG